MQAACDAGAGTAAPTTAGYALLAAGRRAEALRALHDAVRPPGTFAVGGTYIHDGLPLGSAAEPGPDGLVITTDRGPGPSYLFRNGTLVRRLRGAATWIPGTSLIRVTRHLGVEVLRATTGEVVFDAPLVEAFVARKGGFAAVHTECTGTQRLDAFSGDPLVRRPSVTLDPQNRVVPDPASEPAAWVSDDHLWLRGGHASVLVDIDKGKLELPLEGALATERDWEPVPPALDRKHGVMVVHHDGGSNQWLTTTLVDWPTRRVLRRSESGPTASFKGETVFNDTGNAFAMGDGPCEALLFRIPDLSLSRISTKCGGEEGVTGLDELRFWPRNDTLAVHESLAVTVRDVASGAVLAEAPISYFYGSGRFVPTDSTLASAFEIDDCDATGSKHVRIRIDRTLHVTKSETPGKCSAFASTPSATDALVASLSKQMCTVDGFEDALPREVCAALRADRDP